MSNKKKSEQLGMNPGTAANRLKKMLLWKYLSMFGNNICFQCKKPIYHIEELSIEHKEPWLDSEDPVKLYFDLDNVGFSHLSCNIGAKRQDKGSRTEHGTRSRYVHHNCRCGKCKSANARRREQQRRGEKQTGI